MAEQIKSRWQLLGEYLGYPQCCIKAFELLVPFNLRPALVQEMALNGYVPCEKCASDLKLGIVDYDTLINKFRKCSIPFSSKHCILDKLTIEHELSKL